MCSLASDLVSSLKFFLRLRRRFETTLGDLSTLVGALGFCILALSVPSGVARAVPIVYEFAAPFADSSSLGLSSGEIVTVRHGFDTATPDLNGASVFGLCELQSLSRPFCSSPDWA